MRTAFQRDSDRIKHSTAFRRLAGKTQVVINAGEVNQHLRTRLTHAIEVEQVAVGIGGPLGLNTTFLSAAALAHDLGHGPAGHASEEAFSAYLPDGYDHAIYGADVVLAEMNVTDEIRDAVRCHSWRLPSPLTAEGTVVSWADRIAYVAHDWDDAVRGGIIDEAELPEQVRDFGGVRQSDQIGAFIGAIHECVERTGLLGMTQEGAAALEAFRKFNYERIYLRTASRVQAEKAIGLLRALVDYYIDAPGKVPGAYERGQMPRSGSMEATAAAVRYVSGMTDRLALDTGVQVLGYSPSALPRAV